MADPNVSGEVVLWAERIAGVGAGALLLRVFDFIAGRRRSDAEAELAEREADKTAADAAASLVGAGVSLAASQQGAIVSLVARVDQLDADVHSMREQMSVIRAKLHMAEMDLEAERMGRAVDLAKHAAEREEFERNILERDLRIEVLEGRVAELERELQIVMENRRGVKDDDQ